MDSLRPFVEGRESARTIRKRPLFQEVDSHKDKKSIKTE